MNSRSTLQASTQRLFTTFSSTTASNRDKSQAATQFYNIFAARVKIFDPHQTLSLSKVMQQFISQECERRHAPKELNNALISHLAPYRHLPLALGGIAALATTAALARSLLFSPAEPKADHPITTFIKTSPTLPYALIAAVTLPTILMIATLCCYCRRQSPNTSKPLTHEKPNLPTKMTPAPATTGTKTPGSPPATTAIPTRRKDSSSSNDSSFVVVTPPPEPTSQQTAMVQQVLATVGAQISAAGNSIVSNAATAASQNSSSNASSNENITPAAGE